MGEFVQEPNQIFEDFFTRYKAFHQGETPVYISGGSEQEVVDNFLECINRKGESLKLYHGTHSDLTGGVLSRRLRGSLFLAVSPFQSAQYALQRAWTENKGRRLRSRLSKVEPVLIEAQVDLRGLGYEVIHPSPYAEVKADIGLGVSQSPETSKFQLFEVQLVSPHAEKRLKDAPLTVVASGRNITRLLKWSKETLGDFPLDILLEE